MGQFIDAPIGAASLGWRKGKSAVAQTNGGRNWEAPQRPTQQPQQGFAQNLGNFAHDPLGYLKQPFADFGKQFKEGWTSTGGKGMATPPPAAGVPSPVTPEGVAGGVGAAPTPPPIDPGGEMAAGQAASQAAGDAAAASAANAAAGQAADAAAGAGAAGAAGAAMSW